ncbi:MAG: molecular chaperone HtpG [Myxococcota bacterium]
MTQDTQRHAFATEVQDLLHLMVHSLYSNKDIFLRELISNSSDALDKLRFEGLSSSELLPDDELHIRLDVDKEARILTIQDNGIGMSREEIITHLGTIAHSGTKEFLAAAKARQGEQAKEGIPADLIGQFGVGFYSTFMVASKVDVLTRRAGQTNATRWISTGDGGYDLQDAERPQAGTTVTLHLKPTDEDDGLRDYTDTWVLKDIVKKHSDFVAYPIRMRVERREPAVDDQGKPLEGVLPKIVTEDETLNSMKALWTKPRSEVTADESKEFYRHVSHDWGEPLDTIWATMEGTFNARALLYIPTKAPFDLYHRDGTSRGLQLYVKRVFIMEDCEELIAPWLRFIKGVVDSEDLSLNVSREILQKDRQIVAIRKFLTKKVLDALADLKKNRPEDLRQVWREFGPVLKEGLTQPGEYQDKLMDITLCRSSHGDELVLLSDYVERMADKQEVIYYLTGSSLEAVQNSPHLEAFKAKNIEVIYLTDPVDEFWVRNEPVYQGKKFQSVLAGEVELDAQEKDGETKEAQSRAEHFKELLQCLREHLQDDVKEVRLSGRLTESAACLVGEVHDMTPQLAKIMEQLGQHATKTKRILELNPKHPFIEKLQAIYQANKQSTELETYAHLLYGLAVLAEGGIPADPAAYSKKVMDVMLKSTAAAV